MTCSVEGCGNARRSLGYCSKHLSRFRRHGDPLVQHRATSNEGVTPAYKRVWVEQYKMAKGCVDCGYKEHPAALDFDHLPGTVKVRDVKGGQQLGWLALQAEVEKCEVVCACCHRIRTVERNAKLRSRREEVII